VSEEKTTRRTFCGVACRAAAVAGVSGSMATFLQACGSGAVASPSTLNPLPVLAASATGGTASLPIVGTALANVGGAALVQSPIGDFLVAQTAANAFVAVDATCTHMLCTISAVSGQTYVCPCHGSQFAFTGQVEGGPARISLAQHAATLADGVLKITR
jgi:Rieske Fe-S protein